MTYAASSTTTRLHLRSFEHVRLAHVLDLSSSTECPGQRVRVLSVYIEALQCPAQSDRLCPQPPSPFHLFSLEARLLHRQPFRLLALTVSRLRLSLIDVVCLLESTSNNQAVGSYPSNCVLLRTYSGTPGERAYNQTRMRLMMCVHLQMHQS